MDFYILILSAVLPAVILGYYIFKKDQQPEPKRLLFKAVLFGILICLPVSLVEEFLSALFLDAESESTTLTDCLLDAFLVTAVPEECFKLLALWLVVRKNPYFDEHFDGIVYAVCVGLGFAGLENIFYLIDEENWAEVAILRAFMSVPGHYAFAVMMGYYYSVYHFISHSFRHKAMIICVPVMAHGTYDALLMTSGINIMLGVVCFLICILFCFRIHKIASKKISKLLG